MATRGPARRTQAILFNSGQLSELDELVCAVLTHHESLSSTVPSALTVLPTLLRHDNVEELPSPATGPLERTLAFRRFARNASRTVDPHVLDRRGGAGPEFDEVIVKLSRSVERSAWLGEITDTRRRRDKRLLPAARQPERWVNPTGARDLIREVIPKLDMSWVTELTIAEAEPGSKINRQPSPVSVTITLRNKSTHTLKVDVSPYGWIEASSPADGLSASRPILAHRGASTLTASEAVRRSLTPLLGYLIGARLGYPVVQPNGPRYVTAPDGTRKATNAAYMDTMDLWETNRQLNTKLLPKDLRLYLHDHRYGLIARLRAGKHNPDHEKYQRALFAVAPRVKPIVRKYGKRRIPVAVDTPHSGLGAHTAMGLVPPSSNYTPIVADMLDLVTLDPGQWHRYFWVPPAGAIARGLRRSARARDMLWERNDPAPPHKVYQDKISSHMSVNALGGSADLATRTVASLGHPEILGEVIGRRSVATVASGVSDYYVYPSYSPITAIEGQAKSIAARGEAVNEFMKIQKQASRLWRAIPQLMANQNLSEAELTELKDLVHRCREESRRVWDLIEEHGLVAAALRTRLAPVRTPGTKSLLASRVGPSMVGFAGGSLMALLLKEPALIALGVRPIIDTTVGSLRTVKYEQDKARARVKKTKRNNARTYRETDEYARSAEALIGENLGQQLADTLDPLPGTRRKMTTFGPFLRNGAIISAASSPASVAPFWIPGIQHLAPGLAVGGIFSQTFNEAYSAVLDVESYLRNEREDEDAVEIWLAEEAPQTLAEFKAEVAPLIDQQTVIGDRISDAYSPVDLPADTPEVPISEVFEQVTWRGALRLTERFKQLVAQCATGEELAAKLTLLTRDFDKLTDDSRIDAIVEAFDESHESDITAMAKLETLDKYIAEFVESNSRLAALGAKEEDDRTPLNPEYAELAHLVADQWLVKRKPDSTAIHDLTGRFTTIALRVLTDRGIIAPDPADPERKKIDLPKAKVMLPVLALLMAESLNMLDQTGNPESLIDNAAGHGKPTESSDETDDELASWSAQSERWLLSALEAEDFRDRYANWISGLLSDVRSAPGGVRLGKKIRKIMGEADPGTPDTDDPAPPRNSEHAKPLRYSTGGDGTMVPESVVRRSLTAPAGRVIFRVLTRDEIMAREDNLRELLHEYGCDTRDSEWFRTNFLVDPTFTVAVAEHDGNVVGLACAQRTPSFWAQEPGVLVLADGEWKDAERRRGPRPLCFDTTHSRAHIHLVTVHKDLRRRGIGAGLMHYLMSHRDEESITLEVGLNDYAARGFFRRLNVHEDALRPGQWPPGVESQPRYLCTAQREACLTHLKAIDAGFVNLPTQDRKIHVTPESVSDFFPPVSNGDTRGLATDWWADQSLRQAEDRIRSGRYPHPAYDEQIARRQRFARLLSSGKSPYDAQPMLSPRTRIPEIDRYLSQQRGPLSKQPNR